MPHTLHNDNSSYQKEKLAGSQGLWHCPRMNKASVQVATQKAVDTAAAKLGSQAALGRSLGCKRQAINQWKRDGKVPAKWVLGLEALSGVSRYDLRPDIYGPAPRKRQSEKEKEAA